MGMGMGMVMVMVMVMNVQWCAGDGVVMRLPCEQLPDRCWLLYLCMGAYTITNPIIPESAVVAPTYIIVSPSLRNLHSNYRSQTIVDSARHRPLFLMVGTEVIGHVRSSEIRIWAHIPSPSPSPSPSPRMSTQQVTMYTSMALKVAVSSQCIAASSMSMMP